MRRNSFRLEGKYYTFHADNPNDYIQSHHLGGMIYELDELHMLVERLGKKPVIIDVGANVGNHTVYLATQIPGATIYPVEPGRDAMKVLRANLKSNRCRNVDRRFIGVGFSDHQTAGVLRRVSRTNLGGSRILTPQEQADLGDQLDDEFWFQEVPLLQGDDALGDLAPTFIKIDVEGLEMPVLRGLGRVVETHAPEIFVEVEETNRIEFLAWVEEVGYVVEFKTDPSSARSNYLIRPATSDA